MQLADSLEEITESRLRLYIKALRVARADSGQELADRLTDYARELAGDDWEEAWIWRDFVRPTLRYILETADPESGEVIDVVKKEVPERSDEIMTVADELRREGKTETLIDLLEDKIHGNISQKTREKLKDSGDETLDRIKSKFMEIETEADIKKLI